MKKIILTLILAAFCLLEVFAQITIHNLDHETVHGEVSIIDIDSDGDRDILITGDGPVRIQLFRNDGNNVYTKVPTNIAAGGVRGSFDWDDVNGDGLLDVMVSGFEGPITSIFSSDASHVFSKNPATFKQMAPGSGLADLNNDGYTDAYGFGNYVFYNSPASLYFNDQHGGFSEPVDLGNQYWDPVITEVDFDNDGDIDLFVNGRVEAGDFDPFFSKILENKKGFFVQKDLGLIEKGGFSGNNAWGDYDNDGDQDLLLAGDGIGPGVNGKTEDNNDICRLYRNDSGTFVEAAVFAPYNAVSAGDGLRFFDWDNDGDLDVITTGWGGDRQKADIYINTNGIFTPYEYNLNIPGVSESSMDVGDLDDDGDLDFVVTGYSNNNFSGSGGLNKWASVVVENPTTNTNTAPSAPGNPTVIVDLLNKATFAWEPSTDDKTASPGLSYNMFLIKDDKYMMMALSDTVSGKLKIQQIGNVQQNKAWTIKFLGIGKYRWGVQAIDHSFAGSTFATGTFEVTTVPPDPNDPNDIANLPDPVLGVEDDKLSGISVYPNPSDNGKVLIKSQIVAKYEVKVTTIEGKVIHQFKASGISQTELNPGLYIFEVISAKAKGASIHKVFVR